MCIVNCTFSVSIFFWTMTKSWNLGHVKSSQLAFRIIRAESSEMTSEMTASIMGLSRSDETVGIEELSWLLSDMWSLSLRRSAQSPGRGYWVWTKVGETLDFEYCREQGNAENSFFYFFFTMLPWLRVNCLVECAAALNSR